MRSLCEVGGCGSELGERLVLRVADDRHHEALEVEVDGDAEVDGTMHHEVVADDRRVQAGNSASASTTARMTNGRYVSPAARRTLLTPS